MKYLIGRRILSTNQILRVLALSRLEPGFFWFSELCARYSAVAMKTNKDGKITAAAKAAKDAKDAAAPATLNGNGNVEERGDSAKQASSRV